MTTESPVRDRASAALEQDPFVETVDQILDESNTTVDDLVALVSEHREPLAPVTPRVAGPDAGGAPILALCMAMAFIAGAAVAFSPWIPQAVAAVLMTAGACYFSLKTVPRPLAPIPARPVPGGATHSDVAEQVSQLEEETERRDAELREASLKELEKIRVFFEALLEKHVFRINADLRAREAELEELRSRLDASRGERVPETVEIAIAAPVAVPVKEETDEVDLADVPAAGLTTTAADDAGAGAERPEPASRAEELEGIRAGALQPRRTVVELRDLLKELTEGYQERAADRGLKLSSRVAKDMGVAAVDVAMLSRALEEILDNGLAHARKRNGSVWFTATRQDGGDTVRDLMRIRIKDNGRGLSVADQEQLFEPGADGVGLAIARGYARLLEGDVRVESEPRKGTAVVVEIPIVE